MISVSSAGVVTFDPAQIICASQVAFSLSVNLIGNTDIGNFRISFKTDYNKEWSIIYTLILMLNN